MAKEQHDECPCTLHTGIVARLDDHEGRLNRGEGRMGRMEEALNEKLNSWVPLGISWTISALTCLVGGLIGVTVTLILKG